MSDQNILKDIEASRKHMRENHKENLKDLYDELCVILGGQAPEQIFAIGVGSLRNSVSIDQAAILIELVDKFPANPRKLWHELLSDDAEVNSLREMGWESTGSGNLKMNAFDHDGINLNLRTIFYMPAANHQLLEDVIKKVKKLGSLEDAIFVTNNYFQRDGMNEYDEDGEEDHDDGLQDEDGEEDHDDGLQDEGAAMNELEDVTLNDRQDVDGNEDGNGNETEDPNDSDEDSEEFPELRLTSQPYLLTFLAKCKFSEISAFGGALNDTAILYADTKIKFYVPSELEKLKKRVRELEKKSECLENKNECLEARVFELEKHIPKPISNPFCQDAEQATKADEKAKKDAECVKFAPVHEVRGGFRGGSSGGRGGFGDSGGRSGSTPRGEGGFLGSSGGNAVQLDGRAGGGCGGGAAGGMRGGKTVIVEPHRFEGVYIVKGKGDALATRNMVNGESVYVEKRVSDPGVAASAIEYRVWNPFRSKLAAGIMAGVEDIHIKPGSKVLYLGAASGTTVSHVSDIVGSEGIVYAVEFSHRSGRDLLNVSKKRINVVPIVEDARHPHKYSMICGVVDTIFADVAQPNQAEIVAQNAEKFLKNCGHAVISIKANCIDSTAEPEAVFATEINKLREKQFKPIEQVTLEPYERDHAIVVAQYRAGGGKKKKSES